MSTFRGVPVVRQRLRTQMHANVAQGGALGGRASGLGGQHALEQARQRSASIFGRQRIQAEPLPLGSSLEVLGEPSSFCLGPRGRRNLPPDSRFVLDSKVPSPSSLEDARHERTSYHFRKLCFGSD